MRNNRTRAARTRFPRLAVERLECRALPSGSGFQVGLSFTVSPPPVLRELNTADLLPAIILVPQFTVTPAVDPGVAMDQPPTGGSDQTADAGNSGTDNGQTDANGTAPADPPGDSGSPSSTNSGDGTSTVNDSGTNAGLATNSLTTGQDSVTVTPVGEVAPAQDVQVTPISLSVPTLTDGSGDGSGSGQTGDNSGTGDSGSDQHQPPVDPGSGGQNPPPSDSHSTDSGTTGSSANTTPPPASGSSVSSNAGQIFGPATPPDTGKGQPTTDRSESSGSDNSPPNAAAAASAPKPKEGSTPGLSQALAQAEVVRNAQRAGVKEEARAAHAESSHSPDHQGTEVTGDKRVEGAKGNFAATDAPRSQTEPETPLVQTELVPAEAAEPAAAVVRGTAVHGPALLASVVSLDLQAIEQGVAGFFHRIDQLGQQIATAQEQTGLPAWLVALASTGVALEIARRKFRPTQGGPGFGDGDGPAWPWLVDLADPLATNPL